MTNPKLINSFIVLLETCRGTKTLKGYMPIRNYVCYREPYVILILSNIKKTVGKVLTTTIVM